MSLHLNSLVAQLHDSGALKVWSLIITFFGDSIVNRGGNVSANTVQTVLNEIDIGSGAVRTAFSRLASDGWVDRQKQGRRSFYQLTEEGTRPFSQAAKRIYSPIDTPEVQDGNWLLGMHVDKSLLKQLALTDALLLPNRSVLIFNPDNKTTQRMSELGFLSVTGQLDEVPDWVVEHLYPADWQEQIQTLRSGFSIVASNLPADPLSALAARTLLVHQWRRLLLRYPSIPITLKGDAVQAENECREFVSDLYHRLTTPAEHWLNEQGTAINGILPRPQADPADRFTARYLD